MAFQVHKLLGHEMIDSTVGIVGLGSIGEEICKRLKGFGVRRFLYSGHSPKKAGKKYFVKIICLQKFLIHREIR